MDEKELQKLSWEYKEITNDECWIIDEEELKNKIHEYMWYYETQRDKLKQLLTGMVNNE